MLCPAPASSASRSELTALDCLNQHMRKIGNIASNQIYNPQDKKPALFVDIDEVNGVMEGFIRQKYVNKDFISAKTDNTGSIYNTNPDEAAPPLPPKTPGRFVSSMFPASRPAWAGVQQIDTGSVKDKLVRLRDIGFTDDERNAIVLKGVGGNVEKAIEALIRLGESPSLSNQPSGHSGGMSPPTPNPFDSVHTCDDSGYGSLAAKSVAIGKLDTLSERQEAAHAFSSSSSVLKTTEEAYETATVFSDASSLLQRPDVDKYLSSFANELSSCIPPEFVMHNARGDISLVFDHLLKSFAIRLGHESAARPQRQLVYLVYKFRRSVFFSLLLN